MKTIACLALVLVTSFGCADSSWIIESQSDWEQSLGSQSNFEIREGMLTPTAKTASFQSKLKRFDKMRSAQSIVLSQFPIWQNWEPTENIGTISMYDSPVFLSLGPDNYWMFGRYTASRGKQLRRSQGKTEPFVAQPATLEGFDIPLVTTEVPNEFKAPGGLKKNQGGYNAWQSRDMKNWVLHGSITDRFSAWMTTAEYVDGKAYFYYDFPNDQDPHLYIDEDLFDGVPGKNMGLAFHDPSHGSDCGFIRDLEGNFHVIYEDWSPIHANSHAFDSPLAGHAVSADGTGDFTILPPVIDVRTTPTGAIKTYKHPHWVKEDPERFKTDIGEYEVHEPEQDCFGDWSAICIGGQYYLFGDHDPADSKQMSVAWFTSSSLDKQFTFCGDIGRGHPDPDICFAEGRFYLATQMDIDYVSNGPWVETVEVRVGVDTDNDARVDQWSHWQAVKENYDYTPGFVKHVKKTPAAMDLSDLPKGYGFQFELRVTDTTENESKPILNTVRLNFR